MRITRRGYRKNRGFITIVEEKVDTSADQYFAVEWDDDRKVLTVPMPGVPGQTRHEYYIEIAPDELALLVDRMLCGCSEEKTMQAQAKALSAFIREAGKASK